MSAEPAPLPATGARGGWRRSWGLLALLLAVCAWLAFFGTVLAVLASVGVPGDGDNAMRAMRGWIGGGLTTLGLSSLGSLAAAVLGWRLRRGPVCAAIAAALLALLLILAALALTVLR